jgi:acyl-CoA reductase-like NAD-dependent aldehyde dehydrogenase
MGIAEAELQFTPISHIKSIVDKLKTSFGNGRTLPLQYRKQQLKALINIMNENRAAICEALMKDLRKSKFESELFEVDMVIHEAVDMIEHLHEWARPTVVANDMANFTDKTLIRNDPKGTVLIIGAWNYPFQLCLAPLVGAIAGGCTAVVKPSEVSTHSAALLGKLIPKYLDKECYAVVQGAVEETTELLNQEWDHIFYTGNGAVARVVMAAAAKHLTSVTLELGGKCPAIVSDSSDVDVVTNRILSGKLINVGQTCIGIDYVLCTEAFRDKLVQKLKIALEEWYGKDPKTSPDFGRIVNKRHWNRVMDYIKKTKGQIVLGGNADEKDLFISPTVILNPSDSEPLMNEEIFGPILPIKTVKNLDEAVKFVNSRPPPLALYVFSKKDKEIQFVLDRTRSGGVAVNDACTQILCSQLPFGGFGASGMGAYHNKFSFETFTHKRATLIKSQGMEFVNKAARYPKYDDKKKAIMSKVLFKKSPSLLSSIKSRL